MRKFDKIEKVLKELEKEFSKPIIKPIAEIQQVLDELKKSGFPYKR